MEGILKVDHEDESGKQLSKMLKGYYPWGTVSDQLARAAISKIRSTDPRKKAAVISAIWQDQEAFNKLVREGRID